MDFSIFWFQQKAGPGEVTVTIFQANNNTSTNEQITLDNLFTQEQIESGSSLIINIENGAIVGSRNSLVPAFNVSTVHTLAGDVSIINNGTIIGMGGAGGASNGANGANGGTALSTAINLNLTNNGTISGAGGGGGAGGQGGNGETIEFLGQGEIRSFDCQSSCQRVWPGSYCPSNGSPDCSMFTCNTCERSTPIEGGDGGAGGNGAGYLNVNPGTGSAGASPAPGAGAGGTGGTGGTLGLAGDAGQTGANGSSTSGLAGGVGGQPGAATVSNGNTITLTNTGTIQGAQI